MDIYLPTRDECKILVDTSDAFFCSVTEVEGQTVEMYNYRLASHTDFFPEDDSNWTELRGLTFVQQPNEQWQRNILLQKFFNINQTTDWMYDDVKDKKISRVQNKEDGSIVSFIRFANGNIRAKSKMSFTSSQAEMAQDIFMNDYNIRKFVTICLDNNLTPVFELVGPDNQIVLEYKETKLILLQVRRSDGSYEPNPELIANEYNIACTETLPLKMQGLDYLLNIKETSQDDIEGWVVTFDDGQMAKIKTDKYLQLHGLIGPDAFRENLLVKTILDGNIDDVLSALITGNKKNKLIKMVTLLQQHFNSLVIEFIELRTKYFKEFNEVRKDFAIKHSKDTLFSSVIKTLGTSTKDIEKVAEIAVKDYILKQCKGLNDAKSYIKGLE